MRNLVLLILCLFALNVNAQSGIMPADESWPARQPDGTFTGNLKTPDEACKKSIVGTKIYTCGYGITRQSPSDVCRDSFSVAGLPTLAASAYVEGPLTNSDNIVYWKCKSPQYGGNNTVLCNATEVPGIGGPNKKLVYHYQDGSPQAGYCVDENDVPEFNIDQRKIYNCPGGGTWQMVDYGSNKVCVGACPANKPIVNLDTMLCDVKSYNFMARDNASQQQLIKWIGVRQSAIQYNSTVP